MKQLNLFYFYQTISLLTSNDVLAQEATTTIELLDSYLKVKPTSSLFLLKSHQSNMELYRNITKRFNNVTYVTTLDYDRIDFIDGLHRDVAVILPDCCDKEWNRFVANVNKYRQIFNSQKHWLMITEQDNPNFFGRFDDVNLYVNCDLNVAIIKNQELIPIYDVYNVATTKNGPLHVQLIGNYTVKNKTYPTYYEAKYWRRRNMTGITFNTSVVMADTEKMTLYEYLETEKNSKDGSLNRFHYQLCKECRDMYNFTMEVHTVNSWGYLQPDNTIDGLVHLLGTRQVDFGCSPLFSKHERCPFVDHSVGTWMLRSAYLFRRPKSEAPPFEVFVRPLSFTVWLCVGATVLLFVLFMKLVFLQEKENETNVVFAAIVGLGVVCQQGTIHVPTSLSGKISMWVFLLFSLILLQFYSGYILSSVLMDPPRTINTLKDLLDSSLRAGVEDVLYDRDYFHTTTDNVAKELYKRKIRNDSGFYSPEKGLVLVEKGGFAYHVTKSTAYPIISDTFSSEAICELDEVQMHRMQIMHANLQKHSPFKQMVDHCMRRLEENGDMSRTRSHWDARKPKCIKQADKITPVGLQEFSCALIVLAFGVASSLFVLILELLWRRNFNLTKRERNFQVKVIKPYIN